MYEVSGKYCMLCLDKDTIRGEKLSTFLDYLTEHPFINYGLCELNLNSDNEPELFPSLIDSFDFFSYRSRHPSGMFWSTSLFRNTDFISKILSSHYTFVFFPELIFAEISSKVANGCYYRKQLINTEIAEEASINKTLSYDTSQVFFFFPKTEFLNTKFT